MSVTPRVLNATHDQRRHRTPDPAALMQDSIVGDLGLCIDLMQYLSGRAIPTDSQGDERNFSGMGDYLGFTSKKFEQCVRNFRDCA